jgi:hypothetical protein
MLSQIPKVPKAEVLKWRIVIDPRGTSIVGSWTPGENEKLRIETPVASIAKSISSVGLEGHVSSNH